MALIKTTLTITLDEANLLLKLLDEGEALRRHIGKKMSEDKITEGGGVWKKDDPEFQKFQECGQELLAIEAMRRGLRGVST